MTHFLDIPKEKFYYNLLPFLNWNGLLRLRRVCTQTKWITDVYLRDNPCRAPEIEINEADKTLEAFLDMGIPSSRLFLNNSQSGYYFYKQIKETTQHNFLDEFGPLIKHLHVAQLTGYPFGRELDFIDGLKNLETLKVGRIATGRRGCGGDPEWENEECAILAKNKDDLRITQTGLPKIFTSLQALEIGKDDSFSRNVDILQWSGKLMQECLVLKYASLPFDPTSYKTPFGERGDPNYTALRKSMLYLYFYIMERPNVVYSSETGKEQLEIFDFKNYHQDYVPRAEEPMQESQEKLAVIWYGSIGFLHVCLRALKTGLKLRNVNSSWFCARFAEHFGEEYASPELGHVVISLVGLDMCVMQLDMPNLEYIRIPSTSCCVTAYEDRSAWPALKGLDITVDGKEGRVCYVEGRATFEGMISGSVSQKTLGLFQFLFVNIVRTNLSSLSIRFVDGKKKKEVTVPFVDWIVRSCPNLKKIELINWMGTNKQMVELWTGLSGLEEISLENCREMGNRAFVGEKVENPIFLALRRLKKLSLKGLNKMPKISDTLFRLVLSKMKLRELVLTSSEEPLDNVTTNGILALLEGPFAESIERFTFRDWSLADATAEEFEEIGKMFRSYDMN